MTKRKTNIVMYNGRVLNGRDRKIHDRIKKEIAIFIQKKWAQNEKTNKRNISYG